MINPYFGLVHDGRSQNKFHTIAKEPYWNQDKGTERGVVDHEFKLLK